MLEKEYIGRGTLRYVVRDFPMERIHPQAFRAAEAAHCAGEQGKYWEMHHLLFAGRGALGAADLSTHAAALGLDPGRFQECRDKGIHAARIRRDLAEGQRIGVRGTPTFILGMAEDGSRVRVVQTIQGAQPYGTFRAAIEAALIQRRALR